MTRDFSASGVNNERGIYRKIKFAGYGAREMERLSMSNNKLKEVNEWLTKLSMSASVAALVNQSAPMEQSQRGRTFI
jgi:hypothetical protein